MLRAVGGRAEVEHLHVAVAKVLCELAFAVRLPEVRDGVAYEHHLRPAIGDNPHLIMMAAHLPAVGVAIPGSRRYRAYCRKRS